MFNGPPPPGPMGIDPLRSVAKEMKFMTSNIRQLLGSGHPMLDTVSKYYTQSEGKYIRPMLVLLMSQATALLPKRPRKWLHEPGDIDTPLTAPGVLSDANPTSPLTALTEDGSVDDSVLPSQRRLAEITELIHTASLLHDDVIDISVSRRGNPSANISFGNKMAVLAGDFLLGRASVALARLRDPEVTELLATVIANLVEGEFMQLKNTALDEKHPIWHDDTVSYYLQKTYLKSASLISKSCRAAALLGEHPSEVVEAAYQYGKNLGLAFQLVDDMLDYTVSGAELGKPAGADLELGLATAPLLFAWREHKELGTLVGRKFAEPGDVQRAREIVVQSDGIEQTRALAQEYADNAARAISSFPDSEAKTGLLDMCSKVMKRRKIEPPIRLRRAILTSSLPLVTRLICAHPSLLRNPDFTDKSNTSLHLAAVHNLLDIALHLIQAGHEEGVPSSLFPGFDYGDTLEEISRNTDHETPLMLAARHSSIEVGRLLAKHFPGSVTMRNQRGLDALMIACQNPASTALVPVFLQSAGLEAVNGRDLDGNTPLHHASASGSLKALRILLGSGANPMAANAHNWSPLAYSQTVAAEVYFKNLVVELEKRKVEGAKAEEEGRKQKAGGLRVVGPDEEGGGSGGAKAISMTTTRNGEARKQEATPMTPVDDEEVIGDALKRHWSPTIERKRPITPGSGGKASILSHDWDSRLAQSRSRSYSGD